MTVAGLPAARSRPRPRAAAWRARARRRPQLVAEVVAAAAWVLLLAHPLAVAAGVHTHAHATLASWVGMAAAMMLPSAIPAARHVGLNSLCWRRHRAVATYVAAYLAVWAAYGAVALAVAALWRPPLALVLAGAAAWPLTRWHARAFVACHRTVPLRPAGWPATRSVLRFALRNAGGCVGTCWVLMLVMVAAPPVTHLAWTVALAVVVAVQKTAWRPRRPVRATAAAFAGAALVTLPGGALLAAVAAAGVTAVAARVVRTS
ncbi:MAG TPA: DUF2182 domain-containing protein [Frankiaceae bacterium]|nr:DUF2182 domain-containing protein [Frankiaceae bacterium]